MTTRFRAARSPAGDPTRSPPLGRGDRTAPSASDAGGGEPRSYYGKPVIKQPVWSWEIPLYFVTGGVSGASAGLCFAAGLAGHERLARRAQLAAFATIAVSPALLISDLGRPARFLNMLRLFRPSSPMSVGSWLLGASGGATSVAALGTATGKAPRITALARAVAAALGMPLMTYTAVLIADTAVPVWHEGRRELPFVFAGSSTAAGGALTMLLTPHADAGPARRMAVLGTAIEGLATQTMERRLGELAAPLRVGRGGKLALVAKTLASTGAGMIALLGRRRPSAARVGAALVLAGEAIDRWAIFRAGFASADDPRYTVEPQRRRVKLASGPTPPD